MLMWIYKAQYSLGLGYLKDHRVLDLPAGILRSAGEVLNRVPPASDTGTKRRQRAGLPMSLFPHPNLSIRKAKAPYVEIPAANTLPSASISGERSPFAQAALS